MSDDLKHECGIALLRLLKPLDYYREKYGTPFYGLNKLYLLMEKQHNRGQDGAGAANIKLDIKPGNKYISIQKSNSPSSIKDIFQTVTSEIAEACKNVPPELAKDPVWLKNNVRFSGELFMGHLRYGTFGGNSIEQCHPFIRESNWMSRTLVSAGNFNLTNTDELFQELVDFGQHPKNISDSVTILEKIGAALDAENHLMEEHCRREGLSPREAMAYIAKNIDITGILRCACSGWDGGYVMGGMIGHGDAFALRDPAGIRPAYYYVDGEVAAVTSERPVLMTAFNAKFEDVKELPPGHVIIIRRDGHISVEQLAEKIPPKKACSFERIYFSRGTDRDIYRERKELGRNLAPAILESIDDDIENTVFSFIPNTAETCFYGLIDEMRNFCCSKMADGIMKLKGTDFTKENIESLINYRPRFEKVAVKDVKLRTFITEDAHRSDMVAHVYDITYGSIRADKDNLVIIDDSIVRGTTMRESILRILDRLSPKKIIVASSAPQIRYPDCYGIDMAKMGDLVAFMATIELLKENHLSHIIDSVYRKAKAAVESKENNVPNYVKELYAPFSDERISRKVAELLRPVDIKAEVEVIFQSIAGLRAACPDNTGDWYFSGDYPTPHGMKVVNRAFVNFMEGRNVRAY